MPTSKPRRGKRRGPLRRHALLIAAITMFWAALNEPSPWTLSAVIVWLLTAVAVSFLAGAFLALVEPGLLVLIQVWPRRPAPAPPPEVSEP